MDSDQQQQPDKKHVLLQQQVLSQKQFQQQQRSSQQFQRQPQILKSQLQMLETQAQQNQHASQTQQQQLFQMQQQELSQPQPQQNQQPSQAQPKPLLQIQLQAQQRQQLIPTQQLQYQQNQQPLQTQQYQLLQAQPQSQQRQQILQTQQLKQHHIQSQSQQNKQSLQTQQQHVLIQPQSVKRQQPLQTQHQLIQSQQQTQLIQQLSQTQQQQIQLSQSSLQSQQSLQTQQQPQQLLWRKQATLQQRILQQEHLKQQQLLLGRQQKQEQTLRELLQLQDENDDENSTQEERLLVKQQRPQLLQKQQELHLQQQQRQHKEQQQQLLVLQQTQSQTQQQSQYIQQSVQQSQLVQTTQPPQLQDISQIIKQPAIVQISQLEKSQAVIQKPQQVQHTQIITQSSNIQQSPVVQQSQFVQQPQIVQNPHIPTSQQQQQQQQHQYVNVPNQQQIKKQPPFTTQQLQDQLNQLMKNKNYPQRIVVLNGSPNQQQRVISTTNTVGQQQMQCVVVAGTSQQQSQQLQRVKVATTGQQQQQPVQRVVVASAGQQQTQQLQNVPTVGHTQKQQLQQIQHTVPSTSHQQSQQIQSVITTGQTPQHPQQMQRVLVTSTSGQQQQKPIQQLQPVTQRIVIGQLKPSQQTQQLQSSSQRNLVLNQQSQRVLITGQQQLLKLPHQQQSPQQILLQPQLTQQLLQSQQRVNSTNQQVQQEVVQQPQQQMKQQNPQKILLPAQLTQQLLQPQQRVNSTNQQQKKEIIQQSHQIKQHPQKILLQPQLAQQLLQSKSQQCVNFTQQQEGVQQLSQQIKQHIPQHIVITQQQKQQINVKSSDQNLVTLLNVKPSHQQIQQLPIKQPQKQLLQEQLNKEPLLKRSEVIVGTLQSPVQPDLEKLGEPLRVQNSQRQRLQECLLQQQRIQHHKNRENQQKVQLNEQRQLKQHRELREQVLLAQHHKLQKQQQQQKLQQELIFKTEMSSKNRFSFIVGGDSKKIQQDDEEENMLHENKFSVQKPSQLTDKTTDSEQKYHDIDDQEVNDEEHLDLFSSSSDEDEEDDTVHKQRYHFRKAYRLVQERYNALSVALGSKFRIYYDDILRNWMNGRLSHGEYDCEIRKVLYVSCMLPTTGANSDDNTNNASVITTNIPTHCTSTTISFTSSSPSDSSITLTTKTSTSMEDPVISATKVTSKVTTSTLKEKPSPTSSKRKSKASVASRSKKVVKVKEKIQDEDKQIKEISSILTERITLHNAFVSSLIALLPFNLLRLERKKATAYGVSETGCPLRLYTYADVPQVRRSNHHWYPDEPGSLPHWYWPNRLPCSPMTKIDDNTQLSKQHYRKLEQIEAADAAVQAVFLRPPSSYLLPSLLSTSVNIKEARTAQLERSPANVTNQFKWQRIRDKKRLSAQIRMRDNHTKLLGEIKARSRELDGQECWLVERLRQLQQRMSDQRYQVLAQFEIRKQALRVRLSKYINRSCYEHPEDKAKERQLFDEPAITTNYDEEMDVDDEYEEDILFEMNNEKQWQTISESLPKISNDGWRPQSTALMIRLLRDRQRFQACHKLLQRVREERLQASQHIDRVQKLRHLYCPCGISDNRPCQYRKQMRRFRQKLRARELEAIEVAIYRELAEKMAEREKTDAENTKKLIVEKVEIDKLEVENKNVDKKISPHKKKKAKAAKKKSSRSRKKLTAAKSKVNVDALKNIQLKNTTKMSDITTNVDTMVPETLNNVNPVLAVGTHNVGVDYNTICQESPQNLNEFDSVTRSQLKDQRSAVDVAVAAACAAQEALEASKQKRNQKKKTKIDTSINAVTSTVLSVNTNNDQRASELMPPPPPPPPKTATVPKKPTVGARYLLQQQLLLDRHQQLERLRREEAERQKKTYGCRLQENEYIIKEKNDQIEEIGRLEHTRGQDEGKSQQTTKYRFYYDSSGDYYSSDDESFGASLVDPLFPPLLHDLRIDQLPRPSSCVPSATVLPLDVQSCLKNSSLSTRNKHTETTSDYKYKFGSTDFKDKQINRSIKENLAEGESLTSEFQSALLPLPLINSSDIDKTNKRQITETMVSSPHIKLPTKKEKQRKSQTNIDDNQLVTMTNKMEITTLDLSTVQQKSKDEENLFKVQNTHNQDHQADTKPFSIESELKEIVVKQTNKKKSTTKRKRKRIGGGRRKQRKRKNENTILIEEKLLSPEKNNLETVIDVEKYQSLESRESSKESSRIQSDKVPVIDLCIDEDTEMVGGLDQPIEKVPVIDLCVDEGTKVNGELDNPREKVVEIELDRPTTSNEDYCLSKLDQDHSEVAVQLVTGQSQLINSETNQLKHDYREIQKLITQYHKSIELFPPMQRLLKMLLMQYKSFQFPSSLVEEQGQIILELLPNLLSQIKQQQQENIKLSEVVNDCPIDLIAGSKCGVQNEISGELQFDVQNWRDLWPLYDNKSGNANNDTERMCQTRILINHYYGSGQNTMHSLQLQNNKRKEREYQQLQSNKKNLSELPQNKNLLDLQSKGLRQQEQLSQQIQLDQHEQTELNNQPKQIKNMSHHWILNKVVVSSKPYYNEFRPLRKQLLINIANYKHPSVLLGIMKKKLQFAINNNGTSTLSYYDTLTPRRVPVGSNYWWSKNCKQRWVSLLATVDMNVSKTIIVPEQIADLKQQTIVKKGTVTQTFVDKGLKLLTGIEVKKQKFVLDSILNSVRTEDEKNWLKKHRAKYLELLKHSKVLWNDIKINERKQTELLVENCKQQQPTLPSVSENKHKDDPCSSKTVNRELQKQQSAILTVSQGQEQEQRKFGFSIGDTRYSIREESHNQEPHSTPIWVRGRQVANVIRTSELIIASSQLNFSKQWEQLYKINKEYQIRFKRILRQVYIMKDKDAKFTRQLFDRFKEIQNSGMYQEIPCYVAAVKLFENEPKTRVDQLKLLQQLDQDVEYLKSNPNQQHRATLKPKFNMTDNLKLLFHLRNKVHDIRSQRKKRMQQQIPAENADQLELQNKSTIWILRRLALLMHNHRFVLKRQLNRLNVRNSDDILYQQDLIRPPTHLQPLLMLTPHENQESEQKSIHHSRILLTPLQPSTLKLPSPTSSVKLSPEQLNDQKQIIVTIPKQNIERQRESLEIDKRLLLKERYSQLFDKLKPVMELWQLSLRFPKYWLHQQLNDIEHIRRKELMMIEGSRQQHNSHNELLISSTITSQWSWKRMQQICKYLKWRQQRAIELVNAFSVAMDRQNITIPTSSVSSTTQKLPTYSVLLELPLSLTSKLQPLTHSMLLKLPQPLASDQKPLRYSTLLKLQIPSTPQQNSYMYSVLLKLEIPFEENSISHKLCDNQQQLQKEIHLSDKHKIDNCDKQLKLISKKRPTSPPILSSSKRLKPLDSESEPTREYTIVHPATNMRVQMSEKSPLIIKLIKDKPLTSTVSTRSDGELLNYDRTDDDLIKLNEIHSNNSMKAIFKRDQINNKTIQNVDEKNYLKKIESCDSELNNKKKNNSSKDKTQNDVIYDDMQDETLPKITEHQITDKNKTGEKILDHNLISDIHATFYSRPTQLSVIVDRPTKVMDIVNQSIQSLSDVKKLLKVAIIECSPSMTVSKDTTIKVVPKDAKPVKAILVNESIESVSCDSMNAIISKLAMAAAEVALQEMPSTINQLKQDILTEKFECNNIKSSKNLKKIVDVSNIQRQLSIPVQNKTVRRYRRLVRTITMDIHGPDVPTFHDHRFAYGTTERAVHDRFVATILSITAAHSIASYIPPCRPRMPFACSIIKSADYENTNKDNKSDGNGTIAAYTSLQISNLIDGLEKAADYSTNSNCHFGHLSSGCARASGSDLINIVKRMKSFASTLQARDTSTVDTKAPSTMSSQFVGRSMTKETETAPVVKNPEVTMIKPPLNKSFSISLNTISRNNDNAKQSVTTKRPASIAFTKTSSTSPSLPPTAVLYKKPKSAIEVLSVDENIKKPIVTLNKRSAKIAFSSAMPSTSTTVSLPDIVNMPSPSVRPLKISKPAIISANTNIISKSMLASALQNYEKTRLVERSASEAALVGHTNNNKPTKLSTVKLSTPTSSTKESKSAVITESKSTEVAVDDDLNRPEQGKQCAQDTAMITHVLSVAASNSSPLTNKSLQKSTSAIAMTTNKSTIKPELFMSSAYATHKPEPMSASVQTHSNNVGKNMTTNNDNGSHNPENEDDGNTINIKTTTITEEETRTVTVKRTRCPIVTAPMDVTADACTLVVSACEQFVRAMLMERLSKTGRGAGTLELLRRKAFEAAMAVDDDIRPTPEFCGTKTIAMSDTYPEPVTVPSALANDSERIIPGQSLPSVIVDDNSKQSTTMTVETVVETQTTTITTTTTSKINKKESVAETKTVPVTKIKSSSMVRSVVDASSSTWKSGAAVREIMKSLKVPKMVMTSQFPTESSARTRPITMEKQIVSNDKKTTKKPIDKTKSTLHLSPELCIRNQSTKDFPSMITFTNKQTTVPVPQTSIKYIVKPTPSTSSIIDQTSETKTNEKNAPSESTTTVVVNRIVPITIPEKRVPVADPVSASALPRGVFVERGRPLVRPSFHRRQAFGTLPATCSMAAAKATAENRATHRYFNDSDNGKYNNSCSSCLNDSRCIPPYSRLNDFLEDNSTQQPATVFINNMSDEEENYRILLKRPTKGAEQGYLALSKSEHDSSVAFHRQKVMLEVAKQQEQRKQLEQDMERRIQEHQKRPPDSPEDYYQKFLQLQYGASKKPTVPPKLYHPLNYDSLQNHVSWYD